MNAVSGFRQWAVGAGVPVGARVMGRAGLPAVVPKGLRVVLQALILVLGLMLTARAPSAWAAAGTVQVVAGTVRIIQATGQERAAVKGDHLYAGDIVTTGPASNAQIRMIDDARIWLRPQSRFKIEQYPGDQAAAATPQAKAAMRLVEGGLRTVTGAIAQNAPQNYSLKTPNAVIGVRGTEFDAVYLDPRAAAVAKAAAGTYHRVIEGLTEFAPPGGPPLRLRAGESAFLGLNPTDQPQALPQPPSFLVSPPDAPAAPVSRDTETAARSWRLWLRMASPSAQGSQVVASAGGPVEPVQTSAVVREGATARLMLTLPSPPSSRQRRAPEPPTTVTLDMSLRVQGDQASVSLQSPGAGPPVVVTVPLGAWVDISGRAPGRADNRQVLSSTSARPESAQVLIKVEPAGP